MKKREQLLYIFNPLKPASMMLFELNPPAGIQLDMNNLGDAPPSISFSGKLSHIITDDEANAFGIGNFSSRQEIAHLFTNDWFPGTDRWCDYTGLHDDVKNYDIYQQESWNPVSCIYTPISAVVVSSNLTPVATAYGKAINNDSSVLVVQATAATVVTNTVESNWTETHSLEVGQSITYGVGILGLGGQGQTSLSYTDSFGKGGSQSKEVSFNFEQGMTINLAGNSNVEWWIGLTEGIVEYEVTYEVALSGILCWAYDKKFEGHWFYGADVNAGLSLVNKPQVLTVKQSIKVDFNTGATLVAGKQQTNP